MAGYLLLVNQDKERCCEFKTVPSQLRAQTASGNNVNRSGIFRDTCQQPNFGKCRTDTKDAGEGFDIFSPCFLLFQTEAESVTGAAADVTNVTDK